MPDGDKGLVCAYIRPPNGKWSVADWLTVKGWTPEQGLIWVHLDATDTHAQDYLRSQSDIDVVVHEALLAEETRPRSMSVGDGLLAIFRGVNLNPAADPEDMVSLRLWIESTRILSTRRRPLMAVQDVQQRIESGRGPATAGALFVQLTTNLVSRMSGVIDALDDEAGELESSVVDAPSSETRSGLAALRRQTISLRRYLAPQREALNRIQGDELSWLDRRGLANLREQTDRIIRYVEDLDLVRERCAVIQDELMNRQSEKTNKNMYLLAIVAAVMLPLGFVTGLLGINVDGMPGASNTPWAFGAVSIALIIVGAIEVWLLRRLRWF